MTVDFFTFIVVLQALGALFGLVTIVVSYMQPASFNQKIITVTATCSFIGLLSYLLEILATNLEEALLAARFGYLGKSYAMVLFLIFIARYCDVTLPKKMIGTLMVFCTIVFILVLTCPYHSLYYTSIDFENGGIFPHLVLGKGVIYYLYMIVTLLVMLIFMGISISTLTKRKGEERSRLILLCLSGLVPAIALVLNLFPMMQGFDPTPLGIMASCCLVTYNVLRYGLLDTMQLAGANALDYTSQGLVVVNKDYNFLYANKQAFELFPELAGDDENKTSIIDDIFAASREGKTEVTYRKEDKVYELSYSNLSENSKKSQTASNGYMAWIFDITEDYNYTRELEQLRFEAEEANRSKSIFLAKMSHEIRTPMNGIMGFAGLALEKQQDSETEEYLRYIKNSADSLLGIINDILDISKIESGKMEIIDVEYNPIKMFDDVSALISSQAEKKNIEYKAIIPKDLPRYLYGDSIRFREILINLLNNAIKYTKEGSVTLDVSIDEWQEDAITLMIHIKDTGIGIKEDRIEKIFNTFEQGDTLSNYHVEGTGLGLSIAKQLVELMGGSITVTSQYGVGSDFCVILPQKYVMGERKNEVTIEEGNQELELNAKGIRALIVDDNIINLKVEKGILEKYNIVVDLCESGKDALKKTANTKYDVILMDHMMPEMDGLQTMEAIRDGDNMNKTTPILLVTANAVAGIREEMLNKGFDGYVAKPIDNKLLQAELARVLPEETVITQSENIHNNATKDNLMMQISYLGLDTECAIKACGSEEKYKELLETTINEYDAVASKLQRFLDENDTDNYRILTHTLKEDLCELGANEISQQVKDLEYAVKDGDISFIEDYTSNFLKAYVKLMEAIKQLFKDYSS